MAESAAPKLTEARLRVLLYMRETRCVLSRAGGRSSGWTADQYQWPVATAVFEALVSQGLVAHRPASSTNKIARYALTPAGLAALDHAAESSDE